MHNLNAKLIIILEACEHFTKDLVDDKGNIPPLGVFPRFSNLEVIVFKLTAENIGLFHVIGGYWFGLCLKNNRFCSFDKIRVYRASCPSKLSLMKGKHRLLLVIVWEKLSLLQAAVGNCL